MASDVEPPNRPPPGHATAVFVIREVVACLFVLGWLLACLYDFAHQEVAIPFWFHCVGVGVLSYALGISVAELTAFRAPSAGQALRGLRKNEYHGADHHDDRRPGSR